MATVVNNLDVICLVVEKPKIFEGVVFNPDLRNKGSMVALSATILARPGGNRRAKRPARFNMYGSGA